MKNFDNNLKIKEIFEIDGFGFIKTKKDDNSLVHALSIKPKFKNFFDSITAFLRHLVSLSLTSFVTTSWNEDSFKYKCLFVIIVLYKRSIKKGIY